MIDEQRLYQLEIPKETIIANDYEKQQVRFFETNLMDTIDRCENKEIRQVWYKKFNWLQLNINKYIRYLRLKNYVKKNVNPMIQGVQQSIVSSLVRRCNILKTFTRTNKECVVFNKEFNKLKIMMESFIKNY